MRKTVLGFGLGLLASVLALALLGRWPFERQPEEAPPPAVAPPAPPLPPTPSPAPPPTPEPRPPEPATAPAPTEPEDPLRVALRAAIERGGDAGLEEARRIARQLLAREPDDAEAHAVLGDAEFDHPIPEAVSWLGHDFVRDVEEANARRWFAPGERDAFLKAIRAVALLDEHAKRLEEDRAYRCRDALRAEVDRDPYLKDYVWEARDAGPFVVFWTDGTRVNREEMARLPAAGRSKRLDELREKRRPWKRAVAEASTVLEQAYAEFLRRFAKPLDLEDLLGEFGGRPDYPIGKRSFRDGFAIPVIVFGSERAWRDHFEKVVKDPINPGVRGFVDRWPGRILRQDDPSFDREESLHEQLALAATALVRSFQRQRGEWGTARTPTKFFDLGFPAHFAASSMDVHRRLTFTGIHRPHLRAWREIAASLQERLNRAPPPLYGLENLVGFEGYASVQMWALEHWGPVGGAGLQVFRVQSWAFVRFLNEFQGGKYRERWLAFVGDMLNVPRDAEGYAFASFRKRFSLTDKAKWAALDAEFQGYFADLTKTNPDSLGPPPPALSDWPDYRDE